MQRVFLILAMVSLCGHVMTAAGSASAQVLGDDPPPPPEALTDAPPGTPSTPQDEIVEPDTFLLKNKDGELVHVLGFSYEEFQRLYKLDKRLARPDTPPRFGAQRMTITGDLGVKVARLECKLELTTRDEGWVRVPLRLHNSVLAGPVQYAGPGKHFVHFETEGDGFVWWINSTEDAEHELTLNVIAEVINVGSESQLALSLPRFTSSRMTVSIDESRPLLSVSQGTSIVSVEDLGDGNSAATLVGVGGEFQLSWRERRQPSSEGRVALEAIGNVLVRVEGLGNIRSEARLQVRSFGGAFESFFVRLPPGAELHAEERPGYTVMPVDVDPENAGQSERPSVEVKLQRATTGPVEIRIVTDVAQTHGQEDARIEVGGFEVMNVVRQTGHIAIAVEGDTYADWTLGNNIERVNELPESLQQETVIAGFEYFRPSYSLAIQTEARKSRVTVAPRYTSYVGDDHVRLTAVLNYSVRGGKAYFLDIDLSGWTVEEVGSASLIKDDAINLEVVDPLSIPLRQASTGQFAITVTARRTLQVDAATLLLAMPQPQKCTVRPAIVAVVPDDNVRLIPRPGESVGLTPAQTPADMELPERQQEPLIYRAAGDDTVPVFSADMSVQSRSVEVDVLSRVRIDDALAQVEQRLQYRVAYEPVGDVTLELPAQTPLIEDLAVSLDGEPLDAFEIRAADTDTAGDGGDRLRRLNVALPVPQIGTFELVVRFPVRLPPIEVDRSQSFLVPLMTPADQVVTTNHLHILPSESMGIQLLDEAWNQIESTTEVDQANNEFVSANELVFESDSLRREVELVATQAAARQTGAVVVQRAWIQTWLTDSSRQDRAVFRFRSQNNQLQVGLPAGIDTETIQLILDGRPQFADVFAQRGRKELTVTLGGRDPNEEHVLEMWYSSAAGRGQTSLVRVDSPTLEKQALTRQLFWQLVLPRSEHLIVDPAGLTPEFHWGWEGVLWGRRPRLATGDLESLVDASWHEAAAVTSAGSAYVTNRYLFSTFDTVEPIEARIMGRRSLFLLAGGVVLAIGLLVVYFPVMRHPYGALVAAVVLSIAALWFPELALLASQAAGLGIVFVVVGWLLRWALLARHAGAGVVHGSSAPSADGRASESEQLIYDDSGATTTLSSPVRFPSEQQAEAKP